MAIVRHPQALRDLADLARYLAGHSPAVARRFLRAADATLTDLEAQPGIGSPFPSADPRFQGLRYWAVQGFRHHFIFYHEITGGIEVIRVLHGSQDIQAILGGTP